MYGHRYKKIIFPLLFVFLVFIDQLSKYFIRSNGGFYICNKNLAFGIKLPEIFYYALWIIILFASIYFIAKSKSKLVNSNLGKSVRFTIYNLQFTIILSGILILSGAISNIIDRLYFGCVIDFIDLKFWPIFNLADTYITIGSILLIRNILLNNSNNAKCKSQNEK